MSLKRLDRLDGLLAGLCFLAALGLYVRTLAPGLLSGDSGEFQTMAYLLGHTHPTGYPVYLLLARLVTFLPLGSVAYCVNFFSALMAALAVAGVYLTGRSLVPYRSLSLVGALAFAVSPSFWSQALIAEVYTPGAAFLVFILLALLGWEQTGNWRWLFLAGMAGGLSLGVHMSVALLAPAVLLFLLLHWQRGRKMWASALAGAAAGLLVTLVAFLWIDAHNANANYFHSVVEPSYTSWGLTLDQIDEPFERLYFGWSARQFQSFMFSDISRVMPAQAVAYWQQLPSELGGHMVWLAIFGAVVLLIRRTKIAALLLLGLAAQLFYTFNYKIWDLYVFYIPSYLLITLLAIVGIAALVDGMGYACRRFSRTLSGWPAKITEAVITLVVLAWTLAPVFQTLQEGVFSGQVTFEFEEYPVYDQNLLDEVSLVVKELPQGAMVFTDWNRMWPYYYAAHVIQGRSDLTFIEAYPADDERGMAESMIDFIGTHVEEHPIFFAQRDPDLSAAGYTFTPRKIGPIRLLQVINRKP